MLARNGVVYLKKVRHDTVFVRISAVCVDCKRGKYNIVIKDTPFDDESPSLDKEFTVLLVEHDQHQHEEEKEEEEDRASSSSQTSSSSKAGSVARRWDTIHATKLSGEERARVITHILNLIIVTTYF